MREFGDDASPTAAQARRPVDRANDRQSRDERSAEAMPTHRVTPTPSVHPLTALHVALARALHTPRA